MNRQLISHSYSGNIFPINKEANFLLDKGNVFPPNNINNESIRKNQLLSFRAFEDARMLANLAIDSHIPLFINLGQFLIAIKILYYG